MPENNTPNQDVNLLEVVKGLQEQVATLQAEKKAQEQVKKAEEIAEQKVRQLMEQQQREADALESIVNRLVQEKLEAVRKEARIEFPVGLRAGNLKKSDKQLLDVILGRRAMTTTAAGTGAEWIPTELSTELIRDKDKEAVLRQAFRVVDMPTNPFKFPLRTLLPKVYLNNTELTAAPAQSDVGTDDFILTAKKLMSELLVSTEEGEDAVIAVLPEIRAAIVAAFSIAEEAAAIQGDTAGVFTADDDAALPGGNNDPRKAFDGLLKLAAVTQTIGQNAARPTFEEYNKVRAALGKYGRLAAELVWVFGTDAYTNAVINLPEFRTKEKYGEAAVILTGEVGQIGGVPVLVSGGFADATFNVDHYEQKAILTWRRNVVIGDRRQLGIKTQEDIKQDGTLVVPTQRVTINCPLVNGAGKAKGVANVLVKWPQ